MNELTEQKEAIRQVIRGKRKELDPAWVEETSGRIQHRVMGLEPFKRAAVVSCYMALPYEVQTSTLIETCWHQKKRVCVPCFDQAKDRYAWAWIAPGDETRMGHWHIPELDDVHWAHDAMPEVIIVPAVALDAAGRRLGHGGGHYDGLLKHSTGIKIALAFGFQVVEHVPVTERDVPMDVVVSEKDLFEISKSA